MHKIIDNTAQLRLIENGGGCSPSYYELQAKHNGKWHCMSTFSHLRNANMAFSRCLGYRDMTPETPIKYWRRFYRWPE